MISRKALVTVLALHLASVFAPKAAQSSPIQRLLGLPERAQGAPGGSEFMKRIQKLPAAARERMIVKEVLSGNIPQFQRQLVPVERKITSGPYKGKLMRFWVLPDYLAIGSDKDFVRVPLNMNSIRTLAQKLNLSLPTQPMVDDIYAQAQVKLKPTTLPSGREMSSVRYFFEHNSLVQNQLERSSWKPGMLVAGHKKDVVQSLRLIKKPQAVAIYGWHVNRGKPIQPLSTVHGAEYADYSHGVRYVSNVVEINNLVVDLRNVLSQKLSTTLATNPGVEAKPGI
ncbi:MAG TPA: hypothetical protein VFO10_05100 [Oligoflexus sp.]|uniref:hypothetical protein n=1 Tax=Oligoflexus sp. TaxID=1971216 RepID=UPI002D80E380|nr:hypothetical protein [Oligoflexus sp.]HET9236602.1 hypothetical protein [Oligoflexus sp.]